MPKLLPLVLPVGEFGVEVRPISPPWPLQLPARQPSPSSPGHAATTAGLSSARKAERRRAGATSLLLAKLETIGADPKPRAVRHPIVAIPIVRSATSERRSDRQQCSWFPRGAGLRLADRSMPALM
jgi:hypothetical protein